MNETFNPIKPPSLLYATVNPAAVHEIETQTPAGTRETAENAFSLVQAEKNSLETPNLQIPVTLRMSPGHVGNSLCRFLRIFPLLPETAILSFFFLRRSFAVVTHTAVSQNHTTALQLGTE